MYLVSELINDQSIANIAKWLENRYDDAMKDDQE
jgi:hypothetical protein